MNKISKGASALVDMTSRMVENQARYAICVNATRNNTTVALTLNDRVLLTSSGGRFYKKARRAGFEPAYEATTDVINRYFKKENVNLSGHNIHLKLKGFGPGREASIQALRMLNVKIDVIEDCTPIPHGGCRPPKVRRL